MAGYNHQAGMSNNAVDAYGEGKKPLSKITGADLKAVGFKHSLAFAKHLAKTGVWHACEWHHSGGTWYNKVDFYDPSDLASIPSELIDEALAEFKAAKKNDQPKGQRVVGTYPVWGGTRKHPRFLGDEPFTGLLVGNWIHLDKGGKKKADGNGVKWSCVHA